MRLPLRCCLCLALAWAAGVLRAEDGGAQKAGLHWRCWYDGHVHIICLIDSLTETRLAPMQNLPANIPELVRTLRDNPAALRQSAVNIPLFTESYEAGFAAELAQATVCGTRPDCTIDYSHFPPPEGVADLPDKNLPAESDPTEVDAAANR